MQERDDSEQLVRELMRKTKKLQEEQAAAEQSLKVQCKQQHYMHYACHGHHRVHQAMQHLHQMSI